MDGAWMPEPPGMIQTGHGGTEMTEPTPTTRQIEVSDDTYDGLAEFAASRGTDIHGALRYLLESATSAATADGEADDD